MPDGVVLSLGNNNRLNSGDFATAYSSFATDRVLGTGTVSYTSQSGNGTRTGVYYLGTDGGVHFVPDTAWPGGLQSVTVQSAPDFGVTFGTNNNDTNLQGSAGDEVIYGGNSSSTNSQGNDTITANNGNDLVYGGGGNDVIYGGDGNDTLNGGSGNDTVFGGNGNDLLNGGGGNDSLSGGEGNDTIDGGIGDDSIDGGNGNDRIDGGAGNDTIALGEGANTGLGGTGNDTITAGTGADTLFGGAGRDSLSSGAGNDIVHGGDSADTIDSGIGDDTVYGEAGNDSILGGDGNDILYGDDPAPAAVTTETLSWANQAAQGTELRNGFTQDTGNINVSVSFRDDGSLTSTLNTNATVYTGTSGIATDSSIQLLGTNGPTVTTVVDFAADPASGVSDSVTNVGFWVTDIDAVNDGTNNFRDTIAIVAYGPDGVAVPVGITVAGNDTLSGNTVTAAYTNDSPDQAAGAIYVTIAGPVSSFEIAFGNTGTTNHAVNLSDVRFTTIVPTPGDDTIDGGLGNDTLFGGGGSDSLQGGAGNDTLYGEAGNDTLQAGAGNDPVYGGDGTDSIFGNEGNNTLYGDAGSDSITGGTGTDTVFGGLGNDTVAGANGDDILYGGDGQDTVSGDAGNDTVLGDAGNDLLYGGAGDDVVGSTAEAGNDTLYGDAGNDTLHGGVGNDSLFGGTGNDTFVVNDTAGQDIIAGGEDASGTDVDTVTFASATTPQGVTATFTGAETGTYVLNGTTASGTFSQIERIDGTAAADTLDARLSTSSETLSGLGGNDTLRGGTGNDTIFGGDGNDLISGGAGADSLDGGTGTDTLDYAASNAATTVNLQTNTASGGHATGDTIANFENVIGSAFDDNITLSGRAGTITAGDGADTLFGGANDDLIYGGAGNDTLSGGAGNDTLSGDAGSDTFNVDDSHGTTTVIGGEDAGNTDIDRLNLNSTGTPQGVSVTYTGAEAGSFAYTGGNSAGTFTGIEQVTGTAQADTFNAAAATTGVTIASGAGNDSIIGGSGNDVINAGSGADRINAGAGNDTIDLGGADGAADVIVLTDGFGRDTVTTGDTPTQNPDGSWTSLDKLDVTNLHDAQGNPVNTRDVVVSDDGAGNAVLTFPNGESLVVLGMPPAMAADERLLNAFGIPLPDGTVTGTAGDDVIDGSYLGDNDGDRVDGNDAVLPGSAANDDLIEAYGGNDSVSAGNGNDTVYAGTGNDTVSGGDGDDTLFGEAGDDTLDGGAGSNTLFGGAGNDALTSSGGGTLFGGAGSDAITLAAGSGAQIIDGGEDAGDNDTDTLSLTATTPGTGATVTYSGSEAGTITFGGTPASHTFSGIETLSTTAFNDTIDALASTGAINVSTGAGDDIVQGSEFDDTLSGGSGADTIDGRAGNDTIDVGAGDGETDVIVLQDGSGDDLVSGFEAPVDNGDGTFTGRDRFDVSALTDAGGDPVNVNDVVVSDDGAGNTVLSFPNGESVTLTGVPYAPETSVFYLNAMGIPLSDGTVSGTAGDDLIDGSYAGDNDGDYVDGNDAVLANTSGNDDLIEAGDGNDTVLAGDGNDHVFGGTGDDTLYGEAGDDTLEGDEGFDTLYGGDGNDSLYGGFLSGDEIYGGAGDDVIETGFDGEDSTAYGGDGNDLIVDFGSATGTDTFYGGAGNDDILGSFGNDVIYAGTGDDFAVGGEGDDTFVIENNFGYDFYDGGYTDETNGDTIDASAVTVDTVLTMTGPKQGNLTDTASVADGDPATDNVADFFDVEKFFLGSGNDTVFAGEGDDVVDLGAGDDVFKLFNTFGNDTVTGGEAGETTGDTLDGGALTDDITVAFSGPEAGTLSDGTSTATFSEIETVITGAGNDSITGSAGNDTIMSGAGADIINAGAGNDTIDLGAADGVTDTVILQDGSGEDMVFAFEAPTDNGDGTFTGIDQLDVTDLLDAGGDPVNVFDVVVTDDGAGNAVLTFPGGETITLPGVDPSAAANPLYLIAMGIPPSDGTVTGTAGDDLIDGSYIGDNDGDLVDANDAVLAGDTGNDDVIAAGAGNDTILPGDGNDVVYAGTGNDTLNGGAGDDTLYGGDGDDRFTVNNGFGNDVIDGGAGGESAGDTLDLSAVTADLTVDLTNADPETGTASDGVNSIAFTEIENITLGAGADTLTLADNGGADQIDGFTIPTADGLGGWTGVDMLDVSGVTRDGSAPITTNDVTVTDDGNGNALLTFPDGTSLTLNGISPAAVSDPYVLNAMGVPLPDGIVSGTAGDDLIDGSYLDDPDGDRVDNNDAILAGDTGNDDLIHAGAGNDTILPGADNDEVYGGSGDDTVILTDGHGNDDLFGGNVGETSGDVLDATGITSDVNLSFWGPESGNFFDDFGTVSFSDFEQVNLGAGNDTVNAGNGTGRIDTGAGNDTFAGGTGNDDVTLGDGSDRALIFDNFGDDVIIGGESAGDRDWLDGAGVTDNITVNFSGAEAGTFSDGTDTVTFSQIEVITTGSGNDTILGGAGDDSVFTGDGADIVFGGAGSDIFYTGNDSDTIYGGSDDDRIVAGAGDDLLDGGTGADTLDAGTGNDTIDFSFGDTAYGGAGDDVFNLVDTAEAAGGTINIFGGAGDETTGDILRLGTRGNLQQILAQATDDGTGSYSGTATLDDGTTLNFAEIEQIICFTPGTLIATPQGARDIATLRIGDLVMTRDHGLQPIRWIQSRTVPAQGRLAPVLIRPGVVTGLERDLLVSPQHRMLFQGYRAELLFGESEVLVSAKHLVDGHAVTRQGGGDVTYIHMLFDQHEIVYAEGAATESFHPGDVGMDAIHDAGRDELFSIFPELRSDVNLYGNTARRCLKRHEAELLRV